VVKNTYSLGKVSPCLDSFRHPQFGIFPFFPLQWKSERRSSFHLERFLFLVPVLSLGQADEGGPSWVWWHCLHFLTFF